MFIRIFFSLFIFIACEYSLIAEPLASERLISQCADDSYIDNNFWIGSAGMLASFVADRMSYPIARTAGNLVWGLWWAQWLGNIDCESEASDNDSLLESVTPFKKASLEGAIGESSNLFLIPEGLYVHPIYNDVNGNTDKLLTASLKIGLLKSIGSYSTETIAYWRLLTPSYQTEFESDFLKEPVGRFADWGEIKTAVAKVTPIHSEFALRSQLSIGISDIGDKGGRGLHKSFHKLTNNSTDHLEYTDQPKGRFLTVGSEVGILTYKDSKKSKFSWNQLSQLLSIFGEKSRAMNEIGVRYNLVLIERPRYLEHAGEVRVIHQSSSEIYQNIKPLRYEVSYGVRILKYFTPTVKYVSSYLKGDDVGQSYFDLLHFNFEF